MKAYGGNSLAVRLYRTYFEARTSLTDMWSGNPVLTTVLFGLPLGFLSLILYSICCADILDAEEDEEGNKLTRIITVLKQFYCRGTARKERVIVYSSPNTIVSFQWCLL